MRGGMDEHLWLSMLRKTFDSMGNRIALHPSRCQSQKRECVALVLRQRCGCRSRIARNKSLSPPPPCDVATNQLAVAHHAGIVELMGIDIPGPRLALLCFLAPLAAPVRVHMILTLFPATWSCCVLSAILYQATPENTPVNRSFFAKGTFFCRCACEFAIAAAAECTTTVIILITGVHGLIPGTVAIASGSMTHLPVLFLQR